MVRTTKILLGLLIVVSTLAASGCVVEPRRPPPPAACVWVPGHFNAHGYWVPAYCRR